jgi:hypothetical protein
MPLLSPVFYCNMQTCIGGSNAKQGGNMTDFEILVTVAIVAIVVIVKIWILSKI